MVEEASSKELTKQDSKMLQGLSVLAMICVHLFDKDHKGLFTPLIFIDRVPLSFYFGQLSDFCVFGFAFLSGYAHMIQSEQIGYYRRRLKGLLSLLCSYWLIMVVFSVVSTIAGHGDYMPGSVKKFVLNALTLENSYNGAWWYMFTYAILILISPLLLKWVKGWHVAEVLIPGAVIYTAAYYIRFKLGHESWLLGKIGPFGMTLFEYLLGALAYKYRIISSLYSRWITIASKLRIVLGCGVFLLMLYLHTKIIPSLFIAPVTGFIVMTLFHFWEKPEIISKMFVFVGKHATNLWLTHMFFYSVLFKNLVYIARFPILIYGLMLLITFPISIVLQYLDKPIQKLV